MTLSFSPYLMGLVGGGKLLLHDRKKMHEEGKACAAPTHTCNTPPPTPRHAFGMETEGHLACTLPTFATAHPHPTLLPIPSTFLLCLPLPTTTSLLLFSPHLSLTTFPFLSACHSSPYFLIPYPSYYLPSACLFPFVLGRHYLTISLLPCHLILSSLISAFSVATDFERGGEKCLVVH